MSCRTLQSIDNWKYLKIIRHSRFFNWMQNFILCINWFRIFILLLHTEGSGSILMKRCNRCFKRRYNMMHYFINIEPIQREKIEKLVYASQKRFWNKLIKRLCPVIFRYFKLSMDLKAARYDNSLRYLQDRKQITCCAFFLNYTSTYRHSGHHRLPKGMGEGGGEGYLP